ncbi:hypothetical protein MRX96_056933 [Rhipicephalus microplus]
MEGASPVLDRLPTTSHVVVRVIAKSSVLLHPFSGWSVDFRLLGERNGDSRISCRPRSIRLGCLRCYRGTRVGIRRRPRRFMFVGNCRGGSQMLHRYRAGNRPNALGAQVEKTYLGRAGGWAFLAHGRKNTPGQLWPQPGRLPGNRLRAAETWAAANSKRTAAKSLAVCDEERGNVVDSQLGSGHGGTRRSRRSRETSVRTPRLPGLDPT